MPRTTHTHSHTRTHTDTYCLLRGAHAVQGADRVLYGSPSPSPSPSISSILSLHMQHRGPRVGREGVHTPIYARTELRTHAGAHTECHACGLAERSMIYVTDATRVGVPEDHVDILGGATRSTDRASPGIVIPELRPLKAAEGCGCSSALSFRCDCL